MVALAILTGRSRQWASAMESGNIKKQEELRKKKQLWRQGGRPDAASWQHEKGKLTARERLALLFDEGTFVEYGIFAIPGSSLHGIDKQFAPGDGVVTGFGKVDGRLVWAVSQDFTVLGGSMGQHHCRKINRASEEAARNGCPCIYFWDGGGGRLQEAWFDELYKCTILASKNSGYIPTISVICGPCAGASVYIPTLHDFLICVDKTSKFYLCGPKVIQAATGEVVSEEELAGAYTENFISGNAHQWAANDEEAIWHVKKYLSYMPQNCNERTERLPYSDNVNRKIERLNNIIPDESGKTYDAHEVVELLADEDSIYEYQPYWAQNLITCFGRIMGETVGFIANQTRVKAGCFDIDASDKFARFVDILDCYNIPIITLTDTAGFLPGKDQEHGGLIRHGAKALEAVYRTTVPKIQIVMRKQIGGAGMPMGWNLFNLDLNLYWPTLEFGLMDPESACRFIVKQKIKKDPENEKKILEEAIQEFVEARTPYAMAGHLWADDVIEPGDTRIYLIKALEMLQNKNPELVQIPERKKKHAVSPR